MRLGKTKSESIESAVFLYTHRRAKYRKYTTRTEVGYAIRKLIQSQRDERGESGIARRVSSRSRPTIVGLASRAARALEHLPTARSSAMAILAMYGRLRRSRQIDVYLREHETRKLRFGAGSHVDKGWLSTDIIPWTRTTVFMDARESLPLPESSFHYVVCEHMIEHVESQIGMHLIAEFRRILKPGGILRIATPDFGRVINFASNTDNGDSEEEFLVRVTNGELVGVPDEELGNPIYTINRIVRDWGHLFLYDEATLRRAFERAGFTNVTRCLVGESTTNELINVERHQEEVGTRRNLVDTLVLEGTAP